MLKVVKKFIKEKDTVVLKEWCNKSLGYFFCGPPDRYVLRLRKNFPFGWDGKDITDGHFRTETFSLSGDLLVPDCIEFIENLIIKKFNIISEDKPDVFMSLHKEGGCVMKHKHFPREGFCDLRFNIFINKTIGGDIVVKNKKAIVENGDLVIFSGNEEHFSTKVESGDRIILSYGFFVKQKYADKLPTMHQCINASMHQCINASMHQ
jgi:hypothetical protein